MIRWKPSWVLWLVCLVSGGLIITGFAAGWFFGKDGGLDPREVERGKVLFGNYCAQCHGVEGEGQADWREPNPDGTLKAPPHNASGHTWHHGDGLIYRIIAEGGVVVESPGFKSAMPGFDGQLTRQQIEDLMAYLKSLWGPEERKFQAEVSRRDPLQ